MDLLLQHQAPLDDQLLHDNRHYRRVALVPHWRNGIYGPAYRYVLHVSGFIGQQFVDELFVRSCDHFEANAPGLDRSLGNRKFFCQKRYDFLFRLCIAADPCGRTSLRRSISGAGTGQIVLVDYGQPSNTAI